VIGIRGNLKHHLILANLRSSGGPKKTGYVAPKGGLFDYVAAPHYMFELIAWLGMAIAANHLNVYLVFFTMTSYLSGRSVAQNVWNREHFSKQDWPTSRKNLVPFLF
jgi:very-long-chain enoyl-CoA reductase